MNYEEISARLSAQKAFFDTGVTLTPVFRVNALKHLRRAIKAQTDTIARALKTDLGKSNAEAYMSEIGLVMAEISHMIRKLRGYAKDKRVKTPLTQFHSKSYIKSSPYGSVLIMSPWNYPFLLTIGPLVDALAAGNTAIIKPSAYSPATSQAVDDLIRSSFREEYVTVIQGGREENTHLLKAPFDFIFFTGSTNVGKTVLEHAAQRLTPCVLELGGKSPCIVDDTADIKLAARRIVFGKFLNCGQTCVAPDYILCFSSVKDELIAEIKKQVALQYGDNPLDNADYGKIINKKHFERLLNLIDLNKLVLGGRCDPISLRIEPTILDGVTPEDAVMQEEVFGPILPVLTVKTLDEAIAFVKARPHPLALYIFSGNRQNIARVTAHCQFGGGCVNDVVIHLATTEMGFGGVGESGMGAYHGKRGFDTFSHQKSILDKKTWMDLPMRYQPYTKLNDKLIRFFLR